VSAAARRVEVARGPELPAAGARRAYVRECGRRYWPRGEAALEALPVPDSAPPARWPLEYGVVPLPEWAADLGVEGGLLAPRCCGQRWDDLDWWTAAFLMASCFDEHGREAEHGPAHSYSYRLAGVDARVWDRAWVNRIFLFLRRWAARVRGADEVELFGELPPAQFVMTHDVDAVAKTPEIRVKQSAMNAMNAVRLMARGQPGRALEKAGHALRFLLKPGQFDHLRTMRAMERGLGLPTEYNFYGGPGGWKRTPRLVLLDPAYQVDADAELQSTIHFLRDDGCTIGLHPSFAAWQNVEMLSQHRARLETAVQRPVTICRQHWLMFSFEHTWRCQAEAGFTRDSTLGFNDRSGFRNGAALRLRPWDYRRGAPHVVESLPLVLMDSHIYDYQPQEASGRVAYMRRWVDEVRAVRGEATLLWHPHTLSDDYGWKDGFRELIELLER